MNNCNECLRLELTFTSADASAAETGDPADYARARAAMVALYRHRKTHWSERTRDWYSRNCGEQIALPGVTT